MTGTLDPDRVFERVQACLEGVVGGSGHLTSYRLDRESFVLTGCRRLDHDHVEYEFAVDGVRSSEFDVGDESDPETPLDDATGNERLEGAIVLDAAGELVTDETGTVRIRPWRTLDPERWSSSDDGIESLLDDLDREQ